MEVVLPTRDPSTAFLSMNLLHEKPRKIKKRKEKGRRSPVQKSTTNQDMSADAVGPPFSFHNFYNSIPVRTEIILKPRA
mgnify:CR=1 FL=1